MMTVRQRLACSTAPIFLRIALVVAFLFAGFGKLNLMEYSPQQAARLANMGVVRFAPQAPANQPGAPGSTQEGASEPASTEPPAQGGGGGQGGLIPLAQTQGGEQTEEEAQPQEPPPPQSLAGQPPASEQAEDDQPPQQASPPAPQYSAADYAGPVNGRALFRVALQVESAAHPTDGSKAIWPASLAQGRQPVWIAWAVTLTEIAAGVLVLAGALTRLAGLALAGVMVGALWLTSIGPYLWGGKSGWAGFLPPLSDSMAFTGFMLQLSLFCAAMALFCAGSGALSVDRLVFGSPGGKAGDEDEEV